MFQAAMERHPRLTRRKFNSIAKLIAQNAMKSGLSIQEMATELDERLAEEEKRKMPAKLQDLVRKWKEEMGYRDGGEAARKTWEKIKKVATLQEQVNLLEGR
jgi:hypothetical protein